MIERPLAAISPDLPQTLTNFGIADPLTIAIELSFYSGLVLSFPFLVAFPGGICIARADAEGKAHAVPGGGGVAGIVSGRGAVCVLFRAAADAGLLFQLFEGSELAAAMERAGVFFVHDAVHRFVRTGF